MTTVTNSLVSRAVKTTFIYFAAVFAAGFVFGVIRGVLLVPEFGERTAELIEAPFMLIVILLVARHMAGRHSGARAELAIVGAAALLLVLAADVMVGVLLRDMSVHAVFFDRDPIAGSVYYFLLAVFAIAPFAFCKFPR